MVRARRRAGGIGRAIRGRAVGGAAQYSVEVVVIEADDLVVRRLLADEIACVVVVIPPCAHVGVGHARLAPQLVVAHRRLALKAARLAVVVWAGADAGQVVPFVVAIARVGIGRIGRGVAGEFAHQHQPAEDVVILVHPLVGRVEIGGQHQGRTGRPVAATADGDVLGDVVGRFGHAVGRRHARHPPQRVVGRGCGRYAGAGRRLEAVAARRHGVGHAATHFQPPRVVGITHHDVPVACALYLGVVRLRLHQPSQPVVVLSLSMTHRVLVGGLDTPRRGTVAVGVGHGRCAQRVAWRGDCAQPAEGVVPVARDAVVGVRH